MATITLTKNPQRVTVPANTDEHKINLDGVLKGVNAPINGIALIQWVSGTAVQFDAAGNTITSANATLSTTTDKMMLPATLGGLISYKGGAGSEVFDITVLP